MRRVEHTRNTRETQIAVTLNVDGTGAHDIRTGVGFFDHMLETVAVHGAFDLTIKTTGDLHIDQHHTIEDTGIALGEAFAKALGDKRGLTRVGYAYFPLDEALSRAVLDLSGRPTLIFKVDFKNAALGNPEGTSQLQTECVREFFQGFVNALKATLHIDNLRADNEHHKVESAFKAFARALRQAATVDPRIGDKIPSTKGSL